MGLDAIRKLKSEAGIPKAKKYYQIPKVSKKRQKRLSDDNRPDDVKLDEWFLERRREMQGTCACGCGEPSCKKDDLYYRFSICHIFPKAYFKSVMTHPLNWVELNFWKGHHTNFDQQGVEKWVNMSCWDDIKAKVLAMEPYLTQEEKARKFYSTLMELIHSKD